MCTHVARTEREHPIIAYIKVQFVYEVLCVQGCIVRVLNYCHMGSVVLNVQHYIEMERNPQIKMQRKPHKESHT